MQRRSRSHPDACKRANNANTDTLTPRPATHAPQGEAIAFALGGGRAALRNSSRAAGGLAAALINRDAAALDGATSARVRAHRVATRGRRPVHGGASPVHVVGMHVCFALGRSHAKRLCPSAMHACCCPMRPHAECNPPLPISPMTAGDAAPGAAPAGQQSRGQHGAPATAAAPRALCAPHGAPRRQHAVPRAARGGGNGQRWWRKQRRRCEHRSNNSSSSRWQPLGGGVAGTAARAPAAARPRRARRR